MVALRCRCAIIPIGIDLLACGCGDSQLSCAISLSPLLTGRKQQAANARKYSDGVGGVAGLHNSTLSKDRRRPGSLQPRRQRRSRSHPHSQIIPANFAGGRVPVDHRLRTLRALPARPRPAKKNCWFIFARSDISRSSSTAHFTRIWFQTSRSASAGKRPSCARRKRCSNTSPRARSRRVSST